MRSNIVRQYSPAFALGTSRWKGAASFLSTFGFGTSSHESSRSVRCSTSRTECRYSSSLVRSSLPSARRSDFRVVEDGVEHAAALDEARALRGDAARLLAEEAVEDVARIVLGRQRHAVAGKGQRVEFSGRPVPELMESSSDGNRVCLPVTSAMSWSHETVFSYLRRALRVDLRAGEPGVGADVRLAEAVRMMQPAEDREVVAMLRQRLERRRKLVVASRLR